MAGCYIFRYFVLFRFSHINGELLVEVRKMQQRAPETFYAMVKAELNLDFISTLKFTRALDKLT